MHRKLLFKPRPAKETVRRRGCVLKTAYHHPTSQARCDATSIQDIPKPCACAKAHDPTPSCCSQKFRVISPLPDEIEFARCQALISARLSSRESDLFLLMARIPRFRISMRLVGSPPSRRVSVGICFSGSPGGGGHIAPNPTYSIQEPGARSRLYHLG